MGLFAYHILWATPNLPDNWASIIPATFWDYTFSEDFIFTRTWFIRNS